MTAAKSYSIAQAPKFIKPTSLAVCPELPGRLQLMDLPRVPALSTSSATAGPCN